RVLHLFFSYLLPPPPTSTLFPYTTLFRSRVMSKTVDLPPAVAVIAALAGYALLGVSGALLFIPLTAGLLVIVRQIVLPAQDRDRSEEHTSELQSRFDLVCRLLLEKKKKKT